MVLERQLESRVVGRTLNFILSVVGIHWKLLGKGITHFDKHFKEIALAAVKRVNWRGERVGARRSAKRQLQWFVSFRENHAGFQAGNRL